MAGTSSAISISSNALLLLGHSTIASFTDGSTGATVASNLYEDSYIALLEQHRWRFASKTVRLAKLLESPTDKYTSAFQIPSDCVYVITPDTKDYEIYGSVIATNRNELTLEYTYRVSESQLPSYFIKTMEFYLASQFSIPVTGDTTKTEVYGRMYLDQLKKAKFADSTQRPSVPFIDSPYTNIRH